VNDARLTLRRQAESVFVEPEAFCNMLLSGTQLEREDDHAALVRGLRDSASGRIYFVECEQLASYLNGREAERWVPDYRGPEGDSQVSGLVMA